MDVIAYKEVRVTNKSIVDFLSRHVGNELIMQGAEAVLESWCKGLDDIMSKESQKQDDNKVLCYLKGFEERQRQQYELLETQISKNTQDQVSVIETQISKMMIQITETVSNSLQRLNTEKLALCLSENLRGWLEMWLTSSQKDIQMVLKNLQSQLKQDVKDMLNSPMTSFSDSISSKLALFENLFIPLLQKAMGYWSQSKDLGAEIQNTLRVQIDAIPALTKSLIGDVVKDLEDDTRSIIHKLSTSERDVNKLHDCVYESMSLSRSVKEQNETLKQMFDTLDKQLLTRLTKYDSSTRVRCNEGETKLLELLSDKFPLREGYKLDIVSGHARNCDLCLVRENYPTIRIECKAHGKDTHDKVRHKDIEKFERDLMTLNNHGVLVSLYSGIVGMGNCEIRQLANGKFAVYLSNNNFDMDTITTMIKLLYRLDSIVKVSDEADVFKLDRHQLLKIKRLLMDYAQRIQTVKANMKDSITILSDIQFDMIEKLLTNNDGLMMDSDTDNTHNDDLAQQRTKHSTLDKLPGYECDKCYKKLKSKSGLLSHKKTCKA